MQDDGASDADRNTRWAENRTDWAEDRTLQANERTFAGWMRTGMASVALALGLRALFGAFEPTWLAKTVASIFLLIAIGIFWTARRNASKTLERLNDHRAEPLTARNFTLLAAGLTVGALATGVLLWLL
ncbi:DUF202 domain-containing protein [Sulfitobacter sp. BDSS02]|nr:DUF202 domain-containing protein [Sulfitobacter sp. BDSS02]MBR9851709.1 DUF202 domain-containing protein [Paracoccaceae bacterium]